MIKYENNETEMNENQRTGKRIEETYKKEIREKKIHMKITKQK